MNNRPQIFSWIPKLLAVIGLLPFIAGFAWLTWSTASESVERTLQWRLVQAQVVDKSAGADETADETMVKFTYDDRGEPKEVLISRSKGLKGVQAGEVIPLHINQVDPSLAEPARGSDLWATPGLLAFFLVFLIGCFIFLWRVKPMNIEAPQEFMAGDFADDLADDPGDKFEPEPDRFKPDPSRFARGPASKDPP